MSLFFADLVREASWGTGAGDLPLGGALPGHRSFAEAVPPGPRFHYCIAGVTHPQEWETGEGELGSGGSLVRFPLDSSAGGARVDFSPGLKTVALTVAAEWFRLRDEEGDGHGARLEALETAVAGKASLSGAAFTGPVSVAGDLSPTGAIVHAGSLELRGGTQLDFRIGGAQRLLFGSAGMLVNGYVEAAGSGISLRVNSTTSNLNKISLSDNGTIRSYLGASSSALFRVADSSAAERLSLSAAGLSVVGEYRIGGTKVVGSRATGWSTPTGTAARSAFATETVSTAELARRVKALIDDLAAHGLIGS